MRLKLRQNGCFVFTITPYNPYIYNNYGCRESGMAFVVVTGKIISDNTGASKSLPVLMSDEGPVLPLIDYCLTVNRSLSWHEKLVRAVRLFLEYLEANADRRPDDFSVFRGFSKALTSGTIDPHTCEDPSGLYWISISPRDAGYAISMLSDFFNWLGRNENPRAKNFNPFYTGSSFDRKIDLQAYEFRRSKSFLGHAWQSIPEKTGRVIRPELSPKVFPKRPPAFPEDRVEEFLFKGFKVSGKYDYRGMAIACLLLGGGLRVSEPFHMFVSDVQPHWEDSSLPFVTIQHPSLGAAPNNWKNHLGKPGSRAEYLRSEFGLTPRHLIRGKIHAGWKHPALDDRWFMQVHFFPKDFYAPLFFQIWQRYLELVASIERNHPYAWINLDREPVGGIYTMSSFQKAFQSAVERVGLIYGKHFGTSMHGPRHAYGQRARRGDVNEIIIQRIMHHCSPESQRVYTQPEQHEASLALNIAAKKLEELHGTHLSFDRFILGGN
jgi:integrase